jgi:hypothetical protein|tara:strand:- start:755 stop:1000 length:246 start_codon:yes stop_codon:yes gene_type:complete
MNKITTEELEKAKKQQVDLQNILLEIGLVESRKHALLHQIAQINSDTEEFKKELETKYGHVNINLEDGTYTEIENEEDKKD